MMRDEFEKLIGCEITPEEYKKVETVYMAWDYKDMSKGKIAELYKKDKELVTDTLYGYITDQNKAYSARVSECENLRDLITLMEAGEEARGRLTAVMEKYISGLETRVEELETQLHQYKVLFSDIEKSMAVSLYSTLLGVAK